MDRYKIVAASSMLYLEQDVNKLISEGYEPIGHVIILENMKYQVVYKKEMSVLATGPIHFNFVDDKESE